MISKTEKPQKRYRFYKGRPVKRMRRVPEGILLTLLARTAGLPGEQIVVSQEDWDRYGKWRSVPTQRMEELRKLFA